MAEKLSYKELEKRIKELERAVSEQKRTVAFLRENEERWRTLTENFPAFVTVLGRDHKVLSINQIFPKHTMQQVVGTNVTDYSAPEHRKKVKEKIEEVFKTGRAVTFENQGVGPDDEFIWYENYLGPIGAQKPVEKIIFISQNITDRKQTEEALRYFQRAVESSSDAIGISTPDGRHYYQNKAFTNLFGLNPEDVDGEEGPPSTVYRDETIGREVFDTIMQGNEWTGEVEMRDKEGNKFDVHLRAYSIKNEENKVIGLVGVHTDITERKQFEEHLQRSETLLNTTQKLAKIGGWEIDLDTQTIFWTDEVYRIHDMEPNEFTSIDESVKLSLECYRSEDQPVIMKAFTECAEKGQAYDFEFPFTTTNGRSKWIRTITKPVLENDRVVKVVGNFMDITDRKQAEVAIIRSESMQRKMVSNIGDVIVIIDQDGINRYKSPNIEKLFGWKTEDVVGASTWENVHPNDLESTQKFFGDLMLEPNAVGTTECRYKCKNGSYRWIEFTGSNLLHDPDIRGLLGNYHDISHRKQAEESLRESEARFKALHNASFGGIAIHNKGIILECNQGLSELTGYSVTELIGMDGLLLIAEKSRNTVMNNIFEPFYTTKDMDKGTGLGLATVYGIVKQNNGFINVYSEPNEGTTFKIYLPRHQTGAEQVLEKTPEKPDARGSETILLVEDEPSILRMTTIMLEHLDYTVLPAVTPGEAIDMAREHSGDIHLLITDVVMPEMNGRDLASNLLSIYPNLKRLFMSGYTADVIAHHGVLDKGVNFIQKPFSKQDLSVKVRESLDEDKG